VSDFTTARIRIGGVKGVIKLLGDAPEHDHKWKNMPKCPFCGNDGCAGVFNKGGTDFFKCHHATCSSGGAVLTEVGYIAMRLGLSEEKPTGGGASPAYQKFLELAGMWEPDFVPEAPVKGETPHGAGGAPKDVGVHGTGSTDPKAAKEPTPEQGRTNPSAAVVNSAAGALKSEQPAPPASANPAREFGGAAVHPTAPAIVPALPGKAVPEAGAPPDDLPAGLAVLREFYNRLQPTHEQLTPIGKELRRETLLAKRGLTRWTCETLGFRANPRANEKILLALRDEFNWEDLLASGLWLVSDRKRKLDRRVNTQFCGKGQMGRKPEKARRNKADKWIWGWCEPVLIPYFNEAGELVKLRPHKGGAAAGTIAGQERIYVPRDYRHCADRVEKFSTVVICEGEYKAAAIWQEIGGGWVEAEPVGVCAIPGISFARNIEMRADLEAWLVAVGCRRALVAFDDEDNSDRPMRLRHDAKKYARYLAIDLARKLHLTGLVVTLPVEWRNANGKADWDGALAGLLKAKG
jgi:hypothetical protein